MGPKSYVIIVVRCKDIAHYSFLIFAFVISQSRYKSLPYLYIKCMRSSEIAVSDRKILNSLTQRDHFGVARYRIYHSSRNDTIANPKVRLINLLSILANAVKKLFFC